MAIAFFMAPYATGVDNVAPVITTFLFYGKPFTQARNFYWNAVTWLANIICPQYDYVHKNKVVHPKSIFRVWLITSSISGLNICIIQFTWREERSLITMWFLVLHIFNHVIVCLLNMA